MAALDEQLAKLTKDKKRLEEANSRTGESLAQEEDKVKHLSKAKAKLEQQLDEAEEQMEREKRERADLDKARRKLDAELKSTASSLEDMERQKRDVEELVKQKVAEIGNLSSRLEEEHGHVAAAQKKNKELQALLVEADEVGLKILGGLKSHCLKIGRNSTEIALFPSKVAPSHFGYVLFGFLTEVSFVF